MTTIKALRELKHGAEMVMEHNFYNEHLYILTVRKRKCYIGISTYNTLRKKCNTKFWSADKIIKTLKGAGHE